MEVNNNVSGIIGSLTLLFSCITLGQFVLFLSSHTSLAYPNFKSSVSHQTTPHSEIRLSSILCNVGLITVFALQHSLQAHQNFKNFLTRKGLDVFERLLYNCGSCLALQILMWFWIPLPNPTLWSISTAEHPVWWWLFSIVHAVAWLTIYSGCFIMDISELLGAKQVYHYILNWPHPFCQKSDGLLRFYSHMRHPGFSTLAVIFFFHPVMQLDRIILGQGLIVYMILKFKVDDIDYAYQRRMLQRKYRDLNTSTHRTK